MISTRQTALAFALVAPFWLGAAVPAAAQSACGPQVRIAPGDTLSRIARACDVPSGALLRANPDIDWGRLRVGTRVDIPGPPPRDGGPRNGDFQPPPPRGETSYIVRRGDRLDDVAAALGVDVGALLRVNPGLSQRDLIPGREIRLGDRRGPPPPPRRPDIDISVEEDRVEPGDSVTVDLAGLPPRVSVRVRAGPEGGRAVTEGSDRADGDGEASVDIEVPDRARPGERWFVELVGPDGRSIARDRFRIAGRPDDGPRRVTVDGRLTREGIECPALRGDDGRLYTLAGRLRGFETGDDVTVTGRVAEMSTCQQGTTIDVERIEELR